MKHANHRTRLGAGGRNKRNFVVDFVFTPTEKRQSSVFRSGMFYLYALVLHEMLMMKLRSGKDWSKATCFANIVDNQHYSLVIKVSRSLEEVGEVRSITFQEHVDVAHWHGKKLASYYHEVTVRQPAQALHPTTAHVAEHLHGEQRHRV